MPFTEIKATFLSSPHFAVLGASKDQSKVGTKVGLEERPYTFPKLDIVVDFEVVPG